MVCELLVEEASGPLPEGEYAAMPINIYEKEGPHGTMVHMDFRVSTDDEFDENIVSGLASKKLTDRSKLGRWAAALLGYTPEVGQVITDRDLKHRPCRVIVRHRTNEAGTVFANVAQVLPANTDAADG